MTLGLRLPVKAHPAALSACMSVTGQLLSTAHRGGRDTGGLTTTPVALAGSQLGKGGLPHPLSTKAKQTVIPLGCVPGSRPSFAQVVCKFCMTLFEILGLNLRT